MNFIRNLDSQHADSQNQNGGFSIGKLKYEIINDYCDGFERYNTMKIVYTCNDGIQKVTRTFKWINC